MGPELIANLKHNNKKYKLTLKFYHVVYTIPKTTKNPSAFITNA